MLDLQRLPDGPTVVLKGVIQDLMEFTDSDSGELVRMARVAWMGDNKCVKFSDATDASQFREGAHVVLRCRARFTKSGVSLSDPNVILSDGKPVSPSSK